MACPRGKLVRKLLKEMPAPNVVPIRRDPALEDARAELLDSLKAYCEALCGGCELTRR